MIIVAEVGINHNGDMNLCHEMIRQAAISGADMVKFQLYEPKILFADEPHLIEEGERCSIKYDDFRRILDWCNEESIKPFFSVFDETRLEWTENLHMPCYKLASRSIVKTPDFARKVAKLGKETYAALGMDCLEICLMLSFYIVYLNIQLNFLIILHSLRAMKIVITMALVIILMG
jgi:sialic acid synthase SpsE